MDVLEDIYAELTAAGKNDAEHLIKWMRDAKVIAGTRYADARARQLFREAGEDTKVTFDKFQERILVRVAADADTTIEALNRKLESAAIQDHMKKLLLSKKPKVIVETKTTSFADIVISYGVSFGNVDTALKR